MSNPDAKPPPMFNLTRFGVATAIAAAGFVSPACFPERAALAVFWIAPVIAGVVAGARVRRPTIHAALAGVSGPLTALAIAYAVVGPGPESERELFAMFCVVGMYTVICVAVALLTNRASPALGYPAGYCKRCAYNLTGNTSDRCPECAEPTEESKIR